jgi:hypothetical protein
VIVFASGHASRRTSESRCASERRLLVLLAWPDRRNRAGVRPRSGDWLIVCSRCSARPIFKAASTCPTKPDYRKLGYPDAQQQNAYLQLLANGGYMVEKMAKLLHPDGIYIDSSAGHVAAAEQSTATILFEATFIREGMLARADILRKVGARLELMEVKSILFDREDAIKRFEKTGSHFRSMRPPHTISFEWREYLEDVCFQLCIVKGAYTHLEIAPFFVLIDKSYICRVNALPQQFRLCCSATGRLVEVEFMGNVDDLILHPMTVAVDVASEVQEFEPDVRGSTANLHQSLTPMLRRLATSPGRQCLACEHDVPAEVERRPVRSCASTADRRRRGRLRWRQRSPGL